LDQPKRGILLTIFSVLFLIGAIQDALKPFHLEGPQTALVFLGHRLTGAANVVMSIVLAVFLFSYAAGIWRMKKYALAMSFIYGVYVLINLTVFTITYSGQDNGPVSFLIAFTLGAIIIPWGAAITLWRNRAVLA